MRTPVGGFVERVNEGAVSGGAVVASGADLGVEELSLPFLEGEPTVAGDGITVLAPAGVRAGDRVDSGDVLVMAPPDALPDDEWVPTTNWIPSTNWIEGPSQTDFIPSTNWIEGPSQTDFIPSTTWFAGERWVPDDPGSLGVLVATGERSFEGVFGAPAGEMDARPVEEGETFDAEDQPFLVAAPGSVVLGRDSPVVERPESVLDAGRPAPLGGVTFGLGVLSTPDASVADRSANPLVDESTAELLERDALRQLLGRAGATDADDVEWLAGPDALGDVPDGTEFAMLDEEARLESFQGVVGGERGPWWVAVHVARVTAEDHVVAAGVQRAPVGSAERGLRDEPGTAHVRPALEYTAETVGRLRIGE